MDFQVIETGPVPIINLLGNVNAEDTDKLENVVDGLLSGGKYKRILFDITHSKFIASNIFGVMLACANQLRQSGGIVAIAGPSDHNLDVLKLLSMEQYFQVFKTREDALHAIAPPETP